MVFEHPVKMFGHFISFIIFVVFSAYCYNCIKVIPDRAAITFINEKYFCNTSVSVRRSSKRGEYVFNMEGYSKTQLGSNVSVHIAVLEYRSKYNQYVRTFIEFHYKLCELILKDKIIGSTVRRAGMTQCPIPVGHYAMLNMTFNGDIPFDLAFERGKVVEIMKLEPGGEIIGTVEIVVHFQKG